MCDTLRQNKFRKDECVHRQNDIINNFDIDKTHPQSHPAMEQELQTISLRFCVVFYSFCDISEYFRTLAPNIIVSQLVTMYRTAEI